MVKNAFAISRKIFENSIWFLEPFTKAQAWIDLIGNANFRDNEIMIRGNIIKIKRGQLGWSELTMARRWKWSRNKVRRFLSWLEMKQQIEQQKSKLTTLITILNYDDYQFKIEDTIQQTIQEKVQQKDNRKTTDDTTDDTQHNNINNVNKENKYTPLKENRTNNYLKAVEILNYLNQQAGKEYTPNGYVGIIIKQLKRFPLVEDYKRVVDIKVAKWKDVPDWDDKLRPETLFGGKFESYKNEKLITKNKDWEIK